MRHALAVLVLLSLPLSAETRQHGNVIYDVPSGWNVGAVRDDGTLILLSDLPYEACEYCRIYIATSTVTGGRADTWVATQSARLIDPDEEESPEIRQTAAPEQFSLNGLPAARMGHLVEGMMKTEIDHHWLTFRPDGTFYYGPPPAGTSAFDPDERLAAGDMDWG